MSWLDAYRSTLGNIPDIFRWVNSPDYPRDNFYKRFSGKSKTMKKNKRKHRSKR